MGINKIDPVKYSIPISRFINLERKTLPDLDFDLPNSIRNKLIDEISLGDLIRKPGWIRMSIHPTTTTAEIEFVCSSIIELAQNHKTWALDYEYNKDTNEFVHKKAQPLEDELVKEWFAL